MLLFPVWVASTLLVVIYGMVNQRNLASQELLTGSRLLATLRIA